MSAAARKEKRKQENELMKQKQEKLRFANDNPDNLSDLQLFKKFNKNGIEGTLNYYPQCPPEFKDWVFDLTKRNMQKMYEETWGWNDSKKKHELYEDKAHFLILTRDEDNKPIGFVHIRFEFESNSLREFIFEFQVEPEFHRKGVGRFLMQAAEMIALKRGMEMIMLTVFKMNEPAQAFYRSMRYIPHANSPSVARPDYPDKFDYDILYKSLVPKK